MDNYFEHRRKALRRYWGADIYCINHYACVRRAILFNQEFIDIPLRHFCRHVFPSSIHNLARQ